MTIKAGQRRLLLALALGGTVLAAVLAPKGDDAGSVVQAAPRVARTSGDGTAAPAPTTTADTPGLQVLPLQPRRSLAAATLFVVPPPPRPVAVAAATATVLAPADPPLPPYHVVGRYTAGDQQMVLLANGADTEEVIAGDAVANGWHVDRIDDDGVVFVAPSGHRQTLTIDAQDNDKH